MVKDELLVIDRMYELVRWFLGHLVKFPRSHRYGLGNRIEVRLFDVLERLVRAKYGTGMEKQRELSAVNLDLQVRGLALLEGKGGVSARVRWGEQRIPPHPAWL